MAKVKHRLLRVQLIVQQISQHRFKIPMKVKHRLYQISPAPAERKKTEIDVFKKFGLEIIYGLNFKKTIIPCPAHSAFSIRSQMH